jgi:hypothetical protein
MKNKMAEKLCEVINRTGSTGAELSENAVRTLPKLGSYRNEWRQRHVTLYRESDGVVISIGEWFDGSCKLICREMDNDHCYALAAWEAGQRYVAQ